MTEKGIAAAADSIADYVWNGKRMSSPQFEEWLDDYIKQYADDQITRPALEVVRLMYRKLC